MEVNMSYRESEIHQHCAVCSSPGDVGNCPRCARPLCAVHYPQRGRRCEQCEEEYAVRKRRIRYGLLALGAFLPVLAFWLLVLIPGHGQHGSRSWVPAADALVSLCGLGALSVGTVIGLRVMIGRRSFMSERVPVAGRGEGQNLE